LLYLLPQATWSAPPSDELKQTYSALWAAAQHGAGQRTGMRVYVPGVAITFVNETLADEDEATYDDLTLTRLDLT
jgi:hypothetical protein